MSKITNMKKMKFLLLLSSVFLSDLPALEAMDPSEGASATTARKGAPEDTERQDPERAEASSASSGCRLYTVVDENLEKGLFANVIAHTAIGLGAQVGSEPLEQIPYVSEDGVVFEGISRHPFIILKGKPAKLKGLYESLKVAEDIKYVVFLDTMHLGPTAEHQIEATRQRGVRDLKILGVSVFGAIERLAPLMKKFSVYR